MCVSEREREREASSWIKGKTYSVVLNEEVEKGIVRDRRPKRHVRRGFDRELQNSYFPWCLFSL